MKKTIFAALVAALSLVSCSPAFASDASGLFSLVPEGSTLATILGVVVALTHVLAWVPSSWKQNIPDWLLDLFDLVAANYGSAKNEDRYLLRPRGKLM